MDERRVDASPPVTGTQVVAVEKNGPRRPPSRSRVLFRRLRSRSLFIAVTFTLSLVAMALSFIMVRGLTLSMERVEPPNPEAQRHARILRIFANDLTRACNDYARAVPADDTRISPDTRIWVERAFRRDIRFLEQRMDDNMVSGLTPYLTLRAAVHRCGAMARYPDDRTLRRVTLTEVRQAIAEVTAFIDGTAMTESSGQLPERIAFD